LDDLELADGDVFLLPAQLAQTMRLHYSEGFGFIIASFWSDEARHPLGYVHERRNKTLFVPTRHFHHAGDDEGLEFRCDPDSKVCCFCLVEKHC
jgi:hypothetical protein